MRLLAAGSLTLIASVKGALFISCLLCWLGSVVRELDAVLVAQLAHRIAGGHIQFGGLAAGVAFGFQHRGLALVETQGIRGEHRSHRAVSAANGDAVAGGT